MALIDPQDVRDLLPAEDLSDEQIASAGRLVAGWLREDSGRTDVDTLADTDPLYSMALELMVLVAVNPTSKFEQVTGPLLSRWPQASRLDSIRARIRKKYLGGPRGEFPAVERYPEPACPGREWYDPSTRTIWIWS